MGLTCDGIRIEFCNKTMAESEGILERRLRIWWHVMFQADLGLEYVKSEESFFRIIPDINNFSRKCSMKNKKLVEFQLRIILHDLKTSHAITIGFHSFRKLK